MMPSCRRVGGITRQTDGESCRTARPVMTATVPATLHRSPSASLSPPWFTVVSVVKTQFKETGNQKRTKARKASSRFSTSWNVISSSRSRLNASTVNEATIVP